MRGFLFALGYLITLPVAVFIGGISGAYAACCGQLEAALDALFDDQD